MTRLGLDFDPGLTLWAIVYAGYYQSIVNLLKTSDRSYMYLVDIATAIKKPELLMSRGYRLKSFVIENHRRFRLVGDAVKLQPYIVYYRSF